MCRIPSLRASIVSLLTISIYLGIMLWTWGDRTFFDNGARLGVFVLSILLTIASLFATVGGFATGKREDRSNRWIFIPLIPLSLVAAWLPVWSDRHNVLTFGGDGVRYFGLFLAGIGGILRIWPFYVLGKRFSFFVAIQEKHALATDGIYRYIRHPSYLGAILAFFGISLVFRSILGLALSFLFIPFILVRIQAEERLLASEFGPDYQAYRSRTWRLLPYLY